VREATGHAVHSSRVELHGVCASCGAE
jgi:Fe2+ or Zn2+ uptake regulation protein